MTKNVVLMGVCAYPGLRNLGSCFAIMCILYMQERWGSTNWARKAPKDFKTFTFTVMTLQNLFRTSGCSRARLADGVLASRDTGPPSGSRNIGADFGLHGFVDLC